MGWTKLWVYWVVFSILFDRAKPTKIEDRANQFRSDRSDSKCAPVKWAIWSIGYILRSIGQAAHFEKVFSFCIKLFSFETWFPNLSHTYALNLRHEFEAIYRVLLSTPDEHTHLINLNQRYLRERLFSRAIERLFWIIALQGCCCFYFLVEDSSS